MYKISAIVEKEDRWYVSHCVELQVASQGKTIEEALKNLKEAVELYLKHASPDEMERIKKAQAQNLLISSWNAPKHN